MVPVILGPMRRLEIDWLKAIAGSLAAVASAVLLSTLGAAGTIIGAAIGSLVVTIGSALFTEGLATSKRSIEKVQSSAAQKVGIAEAEVSRAGRAEDAAARESHLEHAGERLAEANQELDAAALAATAGPGWRERFAALPWKHIAWVSGALFLAAIVAITAFELVAGRSVSSITGGSGGGRTTIGHVRGGSGGGQGSGGSPSPSETTRPSDQPTQGASQTPTGTTTPTATPTATPTETASPTDTSSATPDTEPTDAARPTGAASP